MAKTTTVVTTFDNVSIKRIAFNFKNAENAIATDCNGQLDGETEMQTVVKKCGATEVKSKSKPINMTVTITAHVPMEVYRRFNGLKQDERIKPGIYSYGPDSVGEDFSLAAEIVDDFEQNSKLVGMLACTSNTGLTFSIENGADEVAALELETKVMQDEFGKFYHEAIVAELEEDLTDQWMTNLSADVIKKSSTTNNNTTQAKKKNGGSEMNEDYSKIELNDGTILNLEPKLNIKKLLMINRDFNTDEFAKMSMGKGSMDITVIQGAKAVYVAYRQANMVDYISFDEFIDKWDFDMEVAVAVYSTMMFKQARDAYQKEFEKANKEKKLQK